MNLKHSPIEIRNGSICRCWCVKRMVKRIYYSFCSAILGMTLHDKRCCRYSNVVHIDDDGEEIDGKSVWCYCCNSKKLERGKSVWWGWDRGWVCIAYWIQTMNMEVIPICLCCSYDLFIASSLWWNCTFLAIKDIELMVWWIYINIFEFMERFKKISLFKKFVLKS